MIGPVKLVLAGGFLAALPVLSAVIPTPDRRGVQDAVVQDKVADDAFRAEAVWNFAVLQFTDGKGELIEIAAKTIQKLWLLSAPEGRWRLEILFANNDYSLIELGSFSIIRRSAKETAVDVPIVRARIDAMAFPAFK